MQRVDVVQTGSGNHDGALFFVGSQTERRGKWRDPTDERWAKEEENDDDDDDDDDDDKIRKDKDKKREKEKEQERDDEDEDADEDEDEDEERDGGRDGAHPLAVVATPDAPRSSTGPVAVGAASASTTSANATTVVRVEVRGDRKVGDRARARAKKEEEGEKRRREEGEKREGEGRRAGEETVGGGERGQRERRTPSDIVKREEAKHARDPEKASDEEDGESEEDSTSRSTAASGRDTTDRSPSSSTGIGLLWSHCWRWLTRRLVARRTTQRKRVDRRSLGYGQLQLCEDLSSLRSRLDDVQRTIERCRAEWIEAGARYSSTTKTAALTTFRSTHPAFAPDGTPYSSSRVAVSDAPSARENAFNFETVKQSDTWRVKGDRCRDSFCEAYPDFLLAVDELANLDKEKRILIESIRVKEQQRRDNRIEGYYV